MWGPYIEKMEVDQAESFWAGGGWEQLNDEAQGFLGEDDGRQRGKAEKGWEDPEARARTVQGREGRARSSFT